MQLYIVILVELSTKWWVLRIKKYTKSRNSSIGIYSITHKVGFDSVILLCEVPCTARDSAVIKKKCLIPLALPIMGAPQVPIDEFCPAK